MSAAAIAATFSTWRPVHGRKVLQLVFEVPIEKQGEVLTMLGAPDDKWCAIALMNGKPIPPASANGRPSDFDSENSGSNPEAGAKDEHIAAPGCGMGCESPRDGDKPTPLARSAGSTPAAAPKSRKHFAGLPLSQQCAIRCGEKQFWEYLRSLVGDEFSSSGQAARVVRDWCTIASRSELDTNDYAARIWKDMESAFQSWLTTQAHAETYR